MNPALFAPLAIRNRVCGDVATDRRDAFWIPSDEHLQDVDNRLLPVISQ
jgi:hypothetical protein